MPNRILREGIKSSGPINALTDKAFRLYINILSCADDFGLLDWSATWLKATAVPLLDTWKVEDLEPLMQELDGRKVVRVYESGSKTYAAVEKWEQRRNSNKPKWPAPPWGFEEGSHMVKKEDGTYGGYVAPRARGDKAPAPRKPPGRINGASRQRPGSDWRRDNEALLAKARELEIDTRGETSENLIRLCEQALTRRERAPS